MRTDIFGTLCFGLAIIHALTAEHLKRLWRPLGEVELTFAVWSLVYLAGAGVRDGPAATFAFVRALSFHEPLILAVVVIVCSGGPVLRVVDRVIAGVAGRLAFDRATSEFASALVVGPLLGSLVGEPAAMTVTALVLKHRFFARGLSPSFKYDVLALLFVNVSIGGLLSTYASPPLVMVVGAWAWTWPFVLRHFAAPAVVGCALTTLAVAGRHRAELRALAARDFAAPRLDARPDPRGAVLVAMFLSGLIVLGPAQRWWVEPVLTRLSDAALYLAAVALTAIVDNAALTYLGAQVPTLAGTTRVALVAGAVVGGGLTIIANAPNAIGFGVLKTSFARQRVGAFALLKAATLPTAIAAVTFYLLG